jgi:long-chain acyl-CoA synthetase
MLPGVGNALVVGERRNYLVALLVLEGENARALAKQKGWPEDLLLLAEDSRLQQFLQEAVERDVNPKLARFETIKRFAVVGREFSIDGGELTPKLSVRRKVVEEKYSALIETLYAETKHGADKAHTG